MSLLLAASARLTSALSVTILKDTTNPVCQSLCFHVTYRISPHFTVAFMPVAVDTSDRIYDDFLRLLFLPAHHEASDLANEIPEESGHFRFLPAACLANIKGSVGLILAKATTMRISIPLDLSSRPFIPLPRFIHSRRPTTLLAPSLVFSPLRSA